MTMAHVVLFHSALGKTQHVEDWAKAIETAGHTVTVPDLFDGETFEDLADGVARRDEIGIPELSQRAFSAVAELPKDIVYAGFSMGAASAQALAFMRPGARGAILMHACLHPQMLGIDAWPAKLVVDVHWATGDPWVESSAIDALEEIAPTGSLRRHEYTGDAHLFGFEGYPEYVEAHATRMRASVLETLAALEERIERPHGER